MGTRAISDQRIYELSNRGLTHTEIQKETGASYSLIQKVVAHGRRFGLCKKMTPERKSELSRRQKEFRKVRVCDV